MKGFKPTSKHLAKVYDHRFPSGGNPMAIGQTSSAPMKKARGGAAHSDVAQDKKLIHSELKKAGVLKKAEGGSVKPMNDRDDRTAQQADARSKASKAMGSMPGALSSMKMSMDKVADKAIMKKAKGGVVNDNELDHYTVERTDPVTSGDAETGGRGPLRPGFRCGGPLKKALGGPVRAAKGGKTPPASAQTARKGFGAFQSKPKFGC